MVTRQNCAFVTYTTREAAETAAERTYNKLIVKGRRLKILWGKSQSEKPKVGDGGVKLTPVPGLPGGMFLNRTLSLFFITFSLFNEILEHFFIFIRTTLQIQHLNFSVEAKLSCFVVPYAS